MNLLGKKCYLKKTGQLGLGKIIGIIHSKEYNNVYMPDKNTWDDLYPGWRDKPIATIQWAKPQKNMSFEEFCNYFASNPVFQAENEQERLYKYSLLPDVLFVNTPLEDVEELGDGDSETN